MPTLILSLFISPAKAVVIPAWHITSHSPQLMKPSTHPGICMCLKLFNYFRSICMMHICCTVIAVLLLLVFLDKWGYADRGSGLCTRKHGHRLSYLFEFADWIILAYVRWMCVLVINECIDFKSKEQQARLAVCFMFVSNNCCLTRGERYWRDIKPKN